MPSLILFEFDFDQVDQLFLTKNVWVRNGKFNLVAKVLEGDEATVSDLKKITKWLTKHGLKDKGQFRIENLSTQELEELQASRNHLLGEAEDSSPYPQVTKEQLDAELDQMQQEREQYFQTKNQYNPWAYQQPEMQVFNQPPTGFQFHPPYYQPFYQPMFYQHPGFSFPTGFSFHSPQSNHWNIVGQNWNPRKDEDEN